MPTRLTRNPGITIRGGEKSIVENNVINLGVPHPINLKNYSGGVAKCHNNQNPAGHLLPGYDENALHSMSELATTIEDALMLSL